MCAPLKHKQKERQQSEGMKHNKKGHRVTQDMNEKKERRVTKQQRIGGKA
jgi:hypothetical protein